MSPAALATNPASPAADAQPPVSPPAVAIDGLSHRYPGGDATRLALRDLSLTIAAGEKFALLGPNGGGKTTTFRILATLLEAAPPSPSVRVFGHDLARDPAAVRRQIGAVFQSPGVDLKLTARENLLVQARLYGLDRDAARQATQQGLEHFNLADRADERTEAFSGGMRRRLEIAKALMHRPRLLLMDEPATGLDPAARRALWDHLEALRQRDGLTIVWTTHQMDEADRADRLAILAEGQLLTTTTPAELKASLGGHVVIAQTTDPADLPTLQQQITADLGPWEDGHAPAIVDEAVRFSHADGPAVVARVAEMMPGRLQRLSVGQPTLEDAYLHWAARPATTT